MPGHLLGAFSLKPAFPAAAPIRGRVPVWRTRPPQALAAKRPGWPITAIAASSSAATLLPPTRQKPWSAPIFLRRCRSEPLAQPRFAICQISGINGQAYYMRGWAEPKDCYTPLVLLSGAQRIGEVHLNGFTGACRRKQPHVARAKYFTYKRADILIF